MQIYVIFSRIKNIFKCRILFDNGDKGQEFKSYDAVSRDVENKIQ